MLFVLAFALLVGLYLVSPAPALAAYTSLISATDFNGIQTDVLTTASGIIAILLIIVGLGILVKVLGR